MLQGSVLSPSLFTIFTLPPGDFIHVHHTNVHLYADDAQLHIIADKYSNTGELRLLSKIAMQAWLMMDASEWPEAKLQQEWVSDIT